MDDFNFFWSVNVTINEDVLAEPGPLSDFVRENKAQQEKRLKEEEDFISKWLPPQEPGKTGSLEDRYINDPGPLGHAIRLLRAQQEKARKETEDYILSLTSPPKTEAENDKWYIPKGFPGG